MNPAAQVHFIHRDRLIERVAAVALVQLEDAIRHSMGATFPMEDFYEEYRKRWMRKVESGKLLANPGIETLLGLLKKQSVPIAVATSTVREHAIETLRTTNLLTYFDTIVGGDNVQNGKPAPDIYRYAAGKINVPTNQCIALEPIL